MNIELIKKYKVEFNYHINGGEVYHCYDNKFLWCSSGHGIWNKKVSGGIITHVIKNDKYVEFRKALVEGREVEYSITDLNGKHIRWVNILEQANSYNIDTKVFNYELSAYRIKPKELQFKDGDWLINTSNDLIFKYNSSIHLQPDTCCIKWKPEINEYCLDLINGRLVKVKEIIKDNITIGILGYKSKCITYLNINNLEPYTEELPIFCNGF